MKRQLRSDPRCTAELFGLKDKRALTLNRILDVHRDPSLPAIVPVHIVTDREVWGESPGLEFYVDFETVNDLDDDFSTLPHKGGQTLIFMVGCGHEENGAWKFECFVADQMDESSEARMIDAWLAHMESVRQRVAPHVAQPISYHWSHAERSFMDTAYNSARNRHQADWPELNWFDFLMRVMKEEPVAVRGAMAFGLKAVAKAMHALEFTETEWTEGPVDGLSAMVAAWRCGHDALESGTPMGELPLMQEIAKYNEVDCKVMWEIVRHLRAGH